jgi:histone-lysine N-methyltransferase SETD8
MFSGYGIFATKQFNSGDFLLNYHGELLVEKEAKERERIHNRKADGCYMFYFKDGGEKLWYVKY